MSNETYIVKIEKAENIFDENGNFLEHIAYCVEKEIPTYLKLDFEDQFGISQTLRIAEQEIDLWLNDKMN